MESKNERITAKICSIKTLLEGDYVKNEGWDPNYVIFGNEKFSRVNIMGIITSKEDNEESTSSAITIDDGTGQIIIRFFEENKNLQSANTGDVVMIIGRPREFGGTRYIVPEIFRKMDSVWLSFRKKQMELLQKNNEGKQSTAQNNSGHPEEHIGNSEEMILDEQTYQKAEETEKDQENNVEKIIKKIKDLDDGNGANFEVVLESLNEIENCENIINNLIKQGDVFEIRPGQLKVIE